MSAGRQGAEAGPRIEAAPRRKDWGDRYLLFLCLVLGGYAFIGKGFAGLGAGSLFIGELALGLGCFAILAAGVFLPLLATAPGVLLAVLMAWVAMRAAPGVGQFGIVALRDAVLVGYGLFAFIVIALLVERPARLALVVRAYGGFARWYVLLGTPVFYLASTFWLYLPLWPVSQVPLIAVRPGEIAVHLTGAAAYTLAGFRRATLPWVAMLALGIVVVSPSRGATLACVVPIAAAIVLSGRTASFTPYLLVGACLFSLGYGLDLSVPLEGGRSMGPRQLVNNFISIAGSSDEANLDNTKAWRLAWWQAIEDYTLHGTYFWTGKGFGESLAEIDGFVVGEESGGPPLRSPHNAHMTMLARSGVPGLALWAAACLAWFAMLGHAMLVARRRNEPGWAGLFIWVSCYLAAILIDASFDVALEGPMLGIWFWCLFGFGIGSVMVYRASLQAAETRRVRANASIPRGPAAIPPAAIGHS